MQCRTTKLLSQKRPHLAVFCINRTANECYDFVRINPFDQNVKTFDTEGKHFFQFSFRRNFNPLCLFFSCRLSKWWIFFVHLERGRERKKNRGVRGVALHFCPINLTQRWELAEKTKHIGLELMPFYECCLYSIIL